MGSGGKLERGGSWVTEREASPAKQSRAQQKEWTPSPDSDLSTASDRQCVCMCVCVCVCVCARTCAYGQANGIWKFPGQGLDPHHCSDPGHCSDNARSLTCCATRGLPGSFWFCHFFLFTAAPVAHGGSQARGPIRAAAVGLYHSHGNTGSKP